VQGKGIGTLAERYGWNVALWAILISTFLGIFLLAFTWKLKPQPVDSDAKAPPAPEPAASGRTRG
jgi:hypothetical protein